jgi:hypothetical protein
MRFYNEKKYYILFFIIILIISLLIPLILYFTSKFEKTITIKEKYTRYRRRSSNYNIVDNENNVYQIGNLWFKGDFNRGDDYAKINIGDTYKVKGYGFRVPFIDMYKQIYEVEQV